MQVLVHAFGISVRNGTHGGPLISMSPKQFIVYAAARGARVRVPGKPVIQPAHADPNP